MSELYEKATPRPWFMDGAGDVCAGKIGLFSTLSERCASDPELVVHAVNNIERIEAENALLRSALEPFSRCGDIPETTRAGVVLSDDRFVTAEIQFSPHEQTVDAHGGRAVAFMVSLDGLEIGDFRRARAALSQSPAPALGGDHG